MYFYFLLVVLKDLKYADSHEWVKIEGNKATVGITDHAQEHLGDVVYVELPDVGRSVSQGESFGAVESVKATSDVNSPISGKVLQVNQNLSESPALVSLTIIKMATNLFLEWHSLILGFVVWIWDLFCFVVIDRWILARMKKDGS